MSLPDGILVVAQPIPKSYINKLKKELDVSKTDIHEWFCGIIPGSIYEIPKGWSYVRWRRRKDRLVYVEISHPNLDKNYAYYPEAFLEPFLC